MRVGEGYVTMAAQLRQTGRCYTPALKVEGGAMSHGVWAPLEAGKGPARSLPGSPEGAHPAHTVTAAFL